MSETTGEVIQQHLTSNEVAANFEFLRSAGLLQDPMAFLNSAEGNNNKALQELTNAIDALASDVAKNMASFGRRLEALEVRSVPEATADARPEDNTLTPAPEAPNPTPGDTSTPEVRSRSSRSTPVTSQPTLWADRSLTETPDYEET